LVFIVQIVDVVVTCYNYLQVKEILYQENVQQKFKEYKMKEDGGVGTGHFGEQWKSRKQLRKGRIRKSSVRKKKVKGKEEGCGSTCAQEVGMWTNLIHLGLGFWSLM
jgi:hypothetical protein